MRFVGQVAPPERQHPGIALLLNVNHLRVTKGAGKKPSQPQLGPLNPTPGARTFHKRAKRQQLSLFTWLKRVRTQRHPHADAGKVGLVIHAVFAAYQVLRAAVGQRHMGAGGLDLGLDVVWQWRGQVLNTGGNFCRLGGGQCVAVKQHNNGAAIGQRGQFLGGLLAALGIRQGQIVGGGAVYSFSVSDKREHGICLSGWLTGGAGWRYAGRGQ